jgi:hypothetical protein
MVQNLVELSKLCIFIVPLNHSGALYLFKEISMKTSLTRIELGLLAALAVALLVAAFGPAIAQAPHYHAFADQRAWWGIPCAMDVLSNVPFAVAGVWGLWTLRPLQADHQAPAHKPLAAVFFAGLVLTAQCSSFYHWQPDNAGLAVDRMGMSVAFAGLLGLSVADRVSARTAWLVALAVLVLGPVAVLVWANAGNLLPWVVLQGGGMVLVLCLVLCKPVSGAWGIPLGWVIAAYAVAKVLELQDHFVFEWTQGWVSGHSLKHAVAALAAWPVIAAVHNVGTRRPL